MNPLARKRLIQLSIIVVVVIAGIFFINNSLLTISSGSDEEKSVYIKSGDSVQNFSLKKGSKTLFLPRGTYDIEISSSDKTSYYQEKLGIFWNNKLNVELKPQRTADYLGEHELKCSRDLTGVTLFYSCSPGSSGAIKSPGNQPSSDQGIPDGAIDFSTALRPYNDLFVEARTENGSLSINRKTKDGVISSTKVSEKFTGTISDATFSATNGGGVAVLDNQAKSVLIFKDSQDQNPLKASVDPKKIEENDFALSVHASQDYTFLVNAPNGEHADNEGEIVHDEAKLSPRIFAIKNNKTSDIKEQKLPKDWIVSAAYGGPANSVVLLLSGNQLGQVFIYGANDGLKKLTGIKDTAQSVCWKDSETFYYKADASRSIFEYSIVSKASFLVYSNLVNFVEEISCADSKLYFSLSNDKTERPGQLSHYVLADQPYSGIRLDNFLPLYHTFSQNTLRISESRGGIIIALDYDSAGDGPPSKELAKQEVAKILGEKGIDVNNLRLNFTY